MGQKQSGHEDEPETDDEGNTESDETASTEKGRRFLGVSFRKMTHGHLSKRCMKFTFLVLNGATFVAGIAAVVTSVWMFADYEVMSRLIGQRIFVTALLLIGVLAAFVALVGIVGLVRRKRKFLSVYITCNSFLLCCVFVCAILSFWLFEQVTRKIQNDMTNSIARYHSWAKDAWDNTHKYLRCCGIRSSKDWASYRANIPQSCCSRSIEQCIKMTEEVAYKSGCLKNAILLLRSHIYTINICTLFVSLILILSVLVAFGIRDKLKYRNRSTVN